MFFIFSCKDKKQNEVSVSTIEAKIDTINEEELKKTEITVDTVRKFCAEDFYGIINKNLIGVENYGNENREECYEKYYVTFESVCYSYNLLKMNIGKEKISLFHYFDTEISRHYDIVNCYVLGESLIIETNSDEISKIVITKQKNIPVFSLSCEGKINDGVYFGIGISNFLIFEKDLEKFGGIPDCGDFEG
ncbi:hypothetical protein [Capnocytophaga cynodegmi]|uniref:hypothetical protein n=1 Tax=Capnocytophaga cynodegmi TaxID=28189 RepID=UPI00385919FE